MGAAAGARKRHGGDMLLSRGAGDVKTAGAGPGSEDKGWIREQGKRAPRYRRQSVQKVSVVWKDSAVRAAPQQLGQLGTALALAPRAQATTGRGGLGAGQ